MAARFAEDMESRLPQARRSRAAADSVAAWADIVEGFMKVFMPIAKHISRRKARAADQPRPGLTRCPGLELRRECGTRTTLHRVQGPW